MGIKDKAEQELSEWVSQQINEGKQVSSIDMMNKYDEIYERLLKEEK